VETRSDGFDSQIGIIVDSVSEVLNVSPDDLENTPSFGKEVDTEFILGMALSREKVRTLLDIDKVLGTETIAALA
jgi:purine-binding chemotaxis protein CheW